MANLTGLVSVVSQLREQRTNLVNNLNRLMRLFQFSVGRRKKESCGTGPDAFHFRASEDCCRSGDCAGLG